MKSFYLDLLHRTANLSRPAKRGIVFGSDIVLCGFAVIVAYSLRLGVLALWTLLFNRILLMSVNPSLAASRGV